MNITDVFSRNIIDTAVPMSLAIDSLETEMLKVDQVPCDVVHSFGPGIYIRQVTLKADTFAIGHYQKKTHFNLMLTGRVSMVSEDGSTKELVAPMMFAAPPGKKMGYVHEECVWLNIYSTDETDIGKLESMFLDKSDAWQSHQKLLADGRSEDKDDFALALSEIGISAEVVRAQSENEADQCKFPLGSYKVKTGASKIDGVGLIATGSFIPGEFIAPARIGEKRTPAGRYTNHAKTPNAEMRLMADGDISLVAIRAINGQMGGNDGEEITVDYRKAYETNMESLKVVTA
jgi:hypothetical protein